MALRIAPRLNIYSKNRVRNDTLPFSFDYYCRNPNWRIFTEMQTANIVKSRKNLLASWEQFLEKNEFREIKPANAHYSKLKVNPAPKQLKADFIDYFNLTNRKFSIHNKK